MYLSHRTASINLMNDQEIGQRIESLRVKLGISQTEFGEAIGVDQSTVSRIESGSRRLVARELVAAARLFGVTVEQIMGQEEELPVLHRGSQGDTPMARKVNEVLSACIDEYRGLENLDR